jgi:hypothetical protein
MLFHKEKKLGIFLVPKTGTTTSRHFLKENGWHLLTPSYLYPEAYIEKYPNLAEYQLYLFLRDPMERFVSVVKHLFRDSSFKSEILTILEKNPANTADISVYQKIVNSFDEVSSVFGVFLYPQSKWAAPSNIEILDFANYESELRRITGADESVEVPVLNKAPEADFGPVPDQVREFIKTTYAQDYALIKERLGKEYL